MKYKKLVISMDEVVRNITNFDKEHGTNHLQRIDPNDINLSARVWFEIEDNEKYNRSQELRKLQGGCKLSELGQIEIRQNVYQFSPMVPGGLGLPSATGENK